MSEIIRLQICLSTLQAMKHFYPEYKSNFVPEEIFTEQIMESPEKVERNEILRTISKVYFETRKAIEYRMDKEKDRVNKVLDEEGGT